MVFWFGIFGEEAKTKIQLLKKSIKFEKGRTLHYYGENWSIFVEESKFSALPTNPIWIATDNNKLGIALHGVAILKDTKIDEFLENPHIHLANLLSQRKSNLISLPKEFTNGSFVGTILKPDEKFFYLFTDFIGSIPLYYIQRKNHLYFSTNLYLLTHHPDIPVEWSPIGIREYLEYGTNIFTESVMKNIKMLNFSSILSFSPRGLSVEYYNILPPENSRNISFKEVRKEFNQLWRKKIGLLASKKINYALGLTGGLDSRLIFTEYTRSNPILSFTGSYYRHPDVILAKRLVSSCNDTSRHIIETYDVSDEQLYTSFIETLLKIENPLLMSDIILFEKFIWKKNTGMEMLLNGLGGEILGGDYIHFDRGVLSSIKNAFFPFKPKMVDSDEESLILKCIRLIFHKSENLYPLLKKDSVGNEENKNYVKSMELFIKDLTAFIGKVNSEEGYLERLRLCLKIPFLRHYKYLSSRDYYETLYPHLDKQLIDYLLSVPIKFRARRKLQISLLQEYYPLSNDVPITSSFLKPELPYFLHRIFIPFVKGINYGLKKRIPILQSKNFDFSKKESIITRAMENDKIKLFLLQVIRASTFCNEKIEEILNKFIERKKFSYDDIYNLWQDVWKLFCLALAEKRFTMDSQNYEKWIKKMS